MRISDWSSDVCPSDLVWLHDRSVETIHTRQLAEHGGVEGVRDRGLLATALAKPLQLHSYGDPPPDLPALAAAYAHGIAHLHPFVDGNKRTSFVAALLFLRVNGQDIRASQRSEAHTSELQSLMRISY